MNISIFGLGYVGTVGIGCLAALGHKVIGVDLNESKVKLLNEGKSPIIENQIDDLIDKQFKKGNVTATNNVKHAVDQSDISFICVGTPSTSNGHLDLGGIYRVAEDIAKEIKVKDTFHVVAIRSTVIPGTNEKVGKIIEKYSGKNIGEHFAVVSNPEFLREGTAVKDYFEPPFTLIGSNSDKAIEMMKLIYKPINAPMVISEIKVAEIIKYVNNSFHALKITFANEVGNICKKLGIDSHELMRIFCMDEKLNLSPYYLKPGFAFGGSCLPKDLKAFRTLSHDLYLKSPVIENIEISNENQKNVVLDKIISFGKNKIGFLGLSFKAGTDDLRNSPIVDVLEKLLGKGYEIKIYDRNIQLSQLIGANKAYILQKIPFISKFISDNLETVIEFSEVIIIVNNEAEFKNALQKIDSDKIIYDLINIDLKNKEKNSGYIGLAW